MEKLNLHTERGESHVVFSRTYEASEMTNQKIVDLEHVERNNFVRARRFGSKIDVDFFDIKNSKLLPATLLDLAVPEQSQTMFLKLKTILRIRTNWLCMKKLIWKYI